MSLEITKKMENVINEKERKVKHLNGLCSQLTALEIKEGNKRTEIFNKIEKEATKKVTDKTKTAEADKILKSEIGQIKHLKTQISNEKREIELLNDRLSLYRNIIRELQL